MKFSKEEKIAYSIAVLGVVILALAMTNIIPAKQDMAIKSNGITIQQQDYKALMQKFPDSMVKVCNIDSGACLTFYDFDGVEKAAGGLA